MICWCVKFGKQTFLVHIKALIGDRLTYSTCLDVCLDYNILIPCNNKRL